MNDCNRPSTTATTASKTAETVYRPQFHTSEDEQGATLRIALPGVRKDDLNLTLREGDLSIDAARAPGAPEGSSPRGGNSPSRYALNIRLSRKFDGTRTEATLDAGVLTLRVPVREEAKPRQIAVN